jgi:hypothetical protein
MVLMAESTPLPERDAALLAFEREWWKYADAKDAAIREHLDLSPESYYQALNAIIDTDAALATDPLLVRRLRRQRASRQRQRQERRHAPRRDPMR